jgi:hypothetical protein
VDHRVEPDQRVIADVAHVDGKFRDRLRRRTEHAVGEKARVEADDLVTRADQDRRHDSSQVPEMPGE